MWKCPNGCNIEEVIASLPKTEDEHDEMSVMVDAQTGKATNRYFDGITGVVPEHAELAEADENPMCPECQSECDWVDDTSEITNSEDFIDSRNIISRIAQLDREQNALQKALDEAQAASDRIPGAVELSEALQEAEYELEDWKELWGDELKSLKQLAEDAEPLAGDWKYGATLIRDSYFEDYAREFARDIGVIQDDTSWPANCIDWEKAVEQLKCDYGEVDFNGETYWVRG
jgi:hypothetical protein